MIRINIRVLLVVLKMIVLLALLTIEAAVQAAEPPLPQCFAWRSGGLEEERHTPNVTGRVDDFVGVYETRSELIGGARLTVTTEGGRLAVGVPGQMAYQLEAPDEEDKRYLSLTDQVESHETEVAIDCRLFTPPDGFPPIGLGWSLFLSTWRFS